LVHTYIAVASSTLSDMDRAVCVTCCPFLHFPHFSHHLLRFRLPAGPTGQPLALWPQVDDIPPYPSFFSYTVLVPSYVSWLQGEGRHSPIVAIGRFAAGHVECDRCDGGTAVVFPPSRSHPGMERDREKGGSGVHRWDNCGTRATEKRLYDSEILADEIRRDGECSG
jgi:hypothetical protein